VGKNNHDIPQAEYLHACNSLAALEMGEQYANTHQPRLVGDLALAESYLQRVLTTNGEVRSPQQKQNSAVMADIEVMVAGNRDGQEAATQIEGAAVGLRAILRNTRDTRSE